MATRFLRINDDFRDSLEETLDRNNCSGKVRPYYHIIVKFLMKIRLFLCHYVVDALEVILIKTPTKNRRRFYLSLFN